MIRKRQRYKPTACYPTLNSAKHESVLERIARRRGCKTDWLVTVSTPKRIEPSGCMKHRRARMPAQKLLPSRVLQRRKLVNASQFFQLGQTSSVPARVSLFCHRTRIPFVVSQSATLMRDGHIASVGEDAMPQFQNRKTKDFLRVSSGFRIL